VSRVTIIRPGAPLAVASNSIIVTPGVASASVTWEIPWFYPNYPITSYSIRVRTLLPSSLETALSVSTNRASISGLTADAAHRLRIASISESGTSDFVERVFQTMPLGQLTSSPESSIIVLPRKPSALRWTHTLSNEVTAVPHFVVNGLTYSLTELDMLDGVSVASTRGSTEVTLSVDAAWNQSVWQWTVEQFGSQLTSQVQVIVAGPPLPPPEPTGVNLTETSLGLILHPPFSHAPLTQYAVLYGVKGRTSGGSMESRTVQPLLGLESEPVKVTLTGLQSEVVYTVIVIASNEVGNSTAVEVDLTLGQSQAGICLIEKDPFWGFDWEFTISGDLDKQMCLSAVQESGVATRQCVEGVWSVPTVDNCRTPSLSILSSNVSTVSLTSCYTVSVVRMCLDEVTSIMRALNDAVTSTRVLFPSDLEVAAGALHNTTSLEKAAIDFNVPIPLQNEATAAHYATVFDAMFNSSRSNGWWIANMDNGSVAADQVLYSFTRTLKILLGVSPTDDPLFSAGTFVSRAGPFTSTERVDIELSRNCRLNAFYAIIDNFAAFLPDVWPSGVTAADVANQLVVVGTSCENTALSNASEIVKVTFKYDQPPYRPLCVVWNFAVSNERVASRGEWSTNGVRTEGDKWSNQITCYSSRALPITILTNYQGPDFTAEGISVALYTGSVVAALLFLISIAPLARFIHIERIADKRVVLNVSQLNYAAVNLVTLIVLAAGVETARNSDISSTFVPAGCKVVSALLHYLYLCTLLWLLAISVVLVCLYAEIGRVLVKRWWPVVIIAYVTPLPIVIIAAPIAQLYYGSELGCWLSPRNGTVFGFVAPAAVVVVATIASFAVACGFICKYKRIDKAKDKDVEIIAQRKELIWTTFIFTFIHFPLLCLAWVFGFIYLGTGTDAYAIVYAIAVVTQSIAYVLFQILRISQIRRFWTETVYTKLKLFFSLSPQRQPTPPISIANAMRTGRYVADGRLGAGVSVMESTDFSPFADTDTSTNQTDTTFIYNW
jgi:hypothetical protein